MDPSELWRNFDIHNLLQQRERDIKQSAMAAGRAEEERAEMQKLADEEKIRQLADVKHGRETVSGGDAKSLAKQKAIMESRLSASGRRLKGIDLNDLVEQLAAPDGGVTAKWVKSIYEKCLITDKDGAGFLSYPEFVSVFPPNIQVQYQGMLEMLFRHLDYDSVGDIEMKELVCSLALFTQGSLQDKCKFAFLLFDDDSSAFLEKDELCQLLYCTQIDQSKEQVDCICDEVYRGLGLQTVQRISFDLFMKICSKDPGLVMAKAATDKCLTRKDGEDPEKAYENKIGLGKPLSTNSNTNTQQLQITDNISRESSKKSTRMYSKDKNGS